MPGGSRSSAGLPRQQLGHQGPGRATVPGSRPRTRDAPGGRGGAPCAGGRPDRPSGAAASAPPPGRCRRTAARSRSAAGRTRPSRDVVERDERNVVRDAPAGLGQALAGERAAPPPRPTTRGPLGHRHPANGSDEAAPSGRSGPIDHRIPGRSPHYWPRRPGGSALRSRGRIARRGAGRRRRRGPLSDARSAIEPDSRPAGPSPPRPDRRVRGRHRTRTRGLRRCGHGVGVDRRHRLHTGAADR